ncbi:MAG: hypothetical protein JKY32_00235 [Rhizobiales bacterium]|nr:hypothetical protein [Hyphomicrobiales bacterium]
MVEFNPAEIEADVSDAGLVSFGWIVPDRDDLAGLSIELPEQISLLLLGNAGADMWQRFSDEADHHGQSLDHWCRATIGSIADNFQARAFYPFEKPHLPFQRWAVQSGSFFKSPLGLTIHPEYGLWHGFRGALLFANGYDISSVEPQVSPCRSCVDRPCLTSCPVNAFSGEEYDVPACVEHLKTRDTTNCLQSACAARRGCPIGKDYTYAKSQATFHMASFMRSFS